VATISFGGLTVYHGKGDGTFTTNGTVFSTLTGAVGIADFNGDGKLDILQFAGNVTVMLGNGNGTFQAPIASASADSADQLAIGDLNGDGKLDIVIYSVAGDTTVLLGSGDGKFQATSESYPGGFVALADLNGDGKLDLVISGTFTQIFLGNGDGTFKDTFLGVLAGGDSGNSTMKSLLIADLNNDSKLDLLVGGFALLGNGDG